MQNWDKQKISAIVSILLAALLALAAVYGYDIKVVQPRETAALQTTAPAALQPTAPLSPPPLLAGRGVTGFNDLAVDNITLTGALVQGVAEVTLTAGMTLTPAASVYLVHASGAVSMTLAAPTVPGQILYLVGDDANTVTVNDTNILTTDGNAVTFGQYDIVEWLSVGSKWLHVAKSANS